MMKKMVLFAAVFSCVGLRSAEERSSKGRKNIIILLLEMGETKKRRITTDVEDMNVLNRAQVRKISDITVVNGFQPDVSFACGVLPSGANFDVQEGSPVARVYTDDEKCYSMFCHKNLFTILEQQLHRSIAETKRRN